MTRFGLVLLVVLAAGPLKGQVGYLPANSPYLDLGSSQEVTLLTGILRTHRDPAGVAPQTGPLEGLGYEWRAGGSPFHLAVNLETIQSKRLIINAAATDTVKRDLGTQYLPLYNADFSVALGLTGSRTWHHLIPMITVGLGTITDLRGRDTSSFDFGTRFSFTWGGGVRWVPNERFQVRADFTDHMYTIDYPESYYEAPAANVPPLLTAAVNKSRWTHNPSLTLGFSFLH